MGHPETVFKTIVMITENKLAWEEATKSTNILNKQIRVKQKVKTKHCSGHDQDCTSFRRNKIGFSIQVTS